MCRSCGCGKRAGTKNSGDGHSHRNAEHSHHFRREIVEIRSSALADNHQRAAQNRRWLEARKIVALNFISSPGAGKTTLLESTLDRLRGRTRCAVIAGDVQTDRDAHRLSGRGAPVRQIETLGACHLDAERVGKILPAVAKKGVRLLFIENVGNLVCPVAYDLGEDMKIAILSVVEGEDKPLKYPALFSAASVAVITKIDLIQAAGWNRTQCLKNIRKVQPRMRIFEVSARTGQGMDEWIRFLTELAGQASATT